MWKRYSSRFQPGEGPSRGLLCDYEPSDGNFWGTSWRSRCLFRPERETQRWWLPTLTSIIHETRRWTKEPPHIVCLVSPSTCELQMRPFSDAIHCLHCPVSASRDIYTYLHMYLSTISVCIYTSNGIDIAHRHKWIKMLTIDLIIYCEIFIVAEINKLINKYR